MIKKTRQLLALVLVAAMSMAANALDLTQAKAQGLIGETQQGYLKARESSSEVNKLVSDVNAKRKTNYEKLAKQNSLTLPQVEKLAGQKAQERTETGNYIYVNGQWVKK